MRSTNCQKIMDQNNVQRRCMLPSPVFAPSAAAPARQSHTRPARNGRVREAELTREERELTEAMRQSLQADTQAFGGLTYQQLLELQTRDLTPEDYERLLMLDNTVKPKTLSEDALAKFARSSASAQHTEQLCTVCQMNYCEGEQLCTLKCGHYFHADCITQWLGNASTKCPIDGLSLQD